MIDLCATATISIPTQTDPADYNYLSSNPSTFTAAYTSSEATCTIVYACVTPVSDPDLCTVGTFDTTTGMWSLNTIDKVSYPPATYYSIEVTGTITGYPLQTNSNIFNLKLIDLCATATVTVPT